MTLTIRLLNGEGHLPIHRQVVNFVRHSISSGRLHAGDKLPSVRELATNLRVSPNTVARAYRELEQEGLTENIAGRGTFIRELMPEHPHFKANGTTALDILRPAVLSVSCLGLGSAEILRMVEKLLVDEPMTLGVVGTSVRSAEKWTNILRHELSEFRVEIVPVVLDDLVDHRDATLKKLANANYVFTLLTGYSLACTSLAGTGKQVLPLISDLSQKSRNALSQLLRKRRIGLVCEDIYANSVLELLSPYCNAAKIVRAKKNTRGEIERLMKAVDVVLYTFGVSETVEAVEQIDCKRVPLEFHLNRENLHQIKKLVSVHAKGAVSRAA